ncbi:hypothetical protein Cantr_06681 [Candida viswanathii]|uniref:F-box domain-containing protein n=1 Tax=Candida viswanathii TaxID=5486 RepID=A0A367XWJ3_9ASCO|nr:hypothetical protein Cantr_06681 [Candida viswanathii]
MTSLTDLPPEVIQTIFEYLPRDVLKTLAELPTVCELAMNALYSVVVIDHNPYLRLHFKKEAAEGVPRMYSSEYVQLRELYPQLATRKLLFDDPFDVFQVLDSPGFDSAKVDIEILFREAKLASHRVFIDEYKKRPFHIKSLLLNPTDDFDYGSIFSMNGSASHFTMRNIIGVKLGKDFDALFPNVSSLSINEPLSLKDLALLPGQLKKLVCRIRQVKDLVSLELPAGLEELSIAAARRNKNVPEISISHLTSLRKLTLRSPLESACPRWGLPSGLHVLKTEYFEMIPEDLVDACPQLRELRIENCEELPAGGVSKALSTPATLRCLQIPSLMLDHDLADDRLQFPAGLTELCVKTIDYDDTSRVLDLDKSDLLTLQRLSVRGSFGCGDLQLVGNFPSGLTNLTLDYIENFHLKDLPYLENLSELDIGSVQETDEFSSRFAPSLRKLAIRGCGLKKVNIEAPNLRYLDLGRNSFETLNEDTFTIPNTVQTLKLDFNRVSDVSVALPNGLQELNLCDNKLRLVPLLPDSLKALDMKYNPVNGSDLDPTAKFPLQLETLQLVSNSLTLAYLKSLNLADCTSLKYLHLTLKNMPKFDLNCLPPSLEVIDFSSNNFSSLTGTFTRFEKLDSVDLSFNGPLRGYFRRVLKKDTPIFGPSLRKLNVDACGLTKPLAETLLERLSQDPNFEQLRVNRELLLDETVNGTWIARKKRKLNK